MKKLLLAVSVLAALASPTWGRTIEEQVLSSLEGQGYVIVEHGYTFLGRLRVVAENGLYRREIVVNPGTGEILRDYAVTLPRNVARSNTPATGGKTAVAAGDGDAVGVTAGNTSNPVTLSLGTSQVAEPDMRTMDLVLPESLPPMSPGVP